MNLHHNTDLFTTTLLAASQHLDVKVEFIEKDYWITLLLNRLAKSNYVEHAVFKGGTSLSKGYNLIERFSEDVDLAIIHEKAKSGNEIKTIIRSIEKEITSELNEVPIDGVTSKGSRFRKSVFEYPTKEKGSIKNRILVEINSFANPFPYKRLTIKSMIFDFLIQTGYEKFVIDYFLQPFEVNVLNKEQTLLEKLVSLIRYSFKENPIESISGKIRHFYDLYYLINQSDCAEFIHSNTFKERFDEILQHDKLIFEEPQGWRSKTIPESPLIVDFLTIWKQIKEKYQTELSAYAYRPIPEEKKVAECFSELIKRIV